MKQLRFFTLWAMISIASSVQAQVLCNGQACPSSNGGATSADIANLTNSVSCGPVTGTLSTAGQYVTLSCPGAGAYNITVSTPSGQSDLTGSLSFTDPITQDGKHALRGGVAALDLSTLSYTGLTLGTRVYNVTGGAALRVTLSAYTSGQITVQIVGSQSSVYPILNGETQTSALVALLNGRSFTAGFPGGYIANVANGNYACLELANPSTSGVRAIFESRQLSNDVVTGQIPAHYYVLGNATTGLPTSAATVNKRGAAGTSALVATYGSLSALPTGGATGLGGYVPTGGTPYSPTLEKTLEPGENTTMCINGVAASGGLTGTATSSPSIVMGWREQAVN